MKKMVMALSAAAIIAAASTASAQGPASVAPAAPARAAVSAVVSEGASVASSVRYVQPRRYVRRTQRQGLFARLIELERRKNAWLVRTFLSR